MTTTANFDLTQTAFLFNWIANSSCLRPGPAGQQADLVYAALGGPGAQNPILGLKFPGLLTSLPTLYGGNWEITWGPGVYQLDPSSGKADNTAFVVYNA